MTAVVDDEFTEIVDANIDKLAAVGRGANGTRFLIAKAAAQGDLVVEPEQALAKADGDDPADVELLAEPDVPAAGDPNVPGSPAWEAIDAATAQAWAGRLARAKNALELLGNREMQEADTGDAGDMDNVFDLGDACAAIDYAIGVLAPYAVSETNEVLTGEEAAAAFDQAVTKAVLGDLPSAWLPFLAPDAVQGVVKTVASAAEGLAQPSVLTAMAELEWAGPVLKSGRVLSATNETAIRDAVDKLTGVLASLPAAPVVKETQMTAPTTAVDVVEDVAKGDIPDNDGPVVAPHGGGEEPADAPSAPADEGEAKAEEGVTSATEGDGADDVAKAKGDPMLPVHDENGKLVGMMDPTDLIPVADAPGKDDAAKDLTPAPSATVGVPADAAAAPVAAVPAPGAVAKAREEILSGLADEVTATVLKAVDARLTAWGETPAPSKVTSNGQLPPAHLMRGLNRPTGTPADDLVMKMREKYDSAGTAPEREAVAGDMMAVASEALTRIHAAGQPI
jgi:hypothetical protein